MLGKFAEVLASAEQPVLDVTEVTVGQTYTGTVSPDGATITGTWQPDPDRPDMADAAYDATMRRIT
jgi:hypothetical protein